MRGKHSTTWRTQVVLRCGTTMLALVALPAMASAESETPADTVVLAAPALIEETSRYPMRLMMQAFDGNQEFSHTQVVGFARMRRGDESWVMVNFGDGAVQIDTPGKTAASAFRNISGTETALRYDYATKTLSAGDGGTANYHNAFVRPQLGRGPALGTNARWTAAMTVEQLGLATLGAQPLSIELSREYFEHGGRQYVLVHYRVPSFGYQSNGRAIVQWAEGAALTDPGFGQMYWSATLSRAVAAQGGTSSRPYRFAKSMTALGKKGAPLVDVRAIPQLAPYLARFDGKVDAAVSGFVEGGAVDQNPIALAGHIDTMALSLAEDSANQLGELTDAYLSGNRGDEVASGVGNVAVAIQGMVGGLKLSPAQVAAVNEALASPGGRQVADAQLVRMKVATPDTTALMGRLSGLMKTVGGDPAMADQQQALGALMRGLADAAAVQSGVGDVAGAIGGMRGGVGDLSGGFGGTATGVGDLGAIARSLGQNPGAAGASTDQLTALMQSLNQNPDVAAKLGQLGQLMLTLNQAQKQAAVASRVDAVAASIADGRLTDSDQLTLDQVNAAIVRSYQIAKEAVAGSWVATVVDYSDKGASIASGIVDVVTKTTGMVKDLNAADAELTAIAAALKAAMAADPGKVIMTDAYAALKAVADAQLAEIRSYDVVFDSAVRGVGTIPPGMTAYYRGLLDTYDASLKSLKAAAETGITYRYSEKIFQLQAQYGYAVKELTRLTEEAGQLGRIAEKLGVAIKVLRVDEVAAVVKQLANSKVAGIASGAAMFLDGFSSIVSGVNIGKSVLYDQSSGNQSLSRNYGDGWERWGLLSLEIAALAGSAVTGNVKSFASGATALTLGSAGDLFISAKGIYDVRQVVAAAQAETERLEAQLAQMRKDKEKQKAFQAALQPKLDAIDKDFEDFMAEVAKSDKVSSDLNSEMLRQIAERRAAKKAAEAAAEREAKAEIARQVAEAKRQNELEYQRNLKRPPTAAEWAKFDKDIADAIKPDYPTAPPLSAAEATARIAAAKLKARLAAEREAAAVADRAAAALAAVEAEKAAKRAASEKSIADASDAIARRAYQAALDKARRDERGKEPEISSLEFEPVTFKPPVWVPPVWKPPVWVPPEFDAPETSGIEWTNFDDDDYPGAKNNLAFKFQDMSGKVATDLGPYAEWLATQDLRLVTRLALQAGYPNLASALADSQNLIKQSQDAGYRKWALQQPSCGGYSGCGPSFLERWTMKQSVVALGDLLADSRGIFSSGGLSDIGISGQNLSYLMRDFGIEDGDIVQIKISQFGKTIYSGRLTLKNAGSAFAIALQRGVAVLEIFAENEGYSSPNTAEIKVDNVVRGESTQSYSLNTGETATLRINSGEKK